MQTYNLVNENGVVILSNVESKIIHQKFPGVDCKYKALSGNPLHGYVITFGINTFEDEENADSVRFKNIYGVRNYYEWIEMQKLFDKYYGRIR